MPSSMKSYGAAPQLKKSLRGGMKRHDNKMKSNYNKEKPGVDKQSSNGVKK